MAIGRGDLVTVRWKDAYFRADEYSSADVEEFEDFAQVVSVGYLLRRSKQSVIVAHEAIREDDGSPTWRGVTVIPRGMVIEIKPFR